MKVSWLIPVRDGQPWLTGAVESACAQCGEGDEVVVVDDGSVVAPDKTLPPHPALRVLHRPRLGIIAALEYGRAQCSNPFIARLDADDVALPGRIAAQRRWLMDHPNAAAVGGRAEMRAIGGDLSEGMQRYVDWVNGLEDLHAQLLVESPLFHPAVTMRASAVDAVGGYRDVGLPEDYDLWLRLVNEGYSIGSVEETVVQLRDHPGRLTRTHARYSRAAFDRAKQAWLRAGAFSAQRRVAVWGAGRTGRRWVRWLSEQGHAVVAVIDPFQGTSRQGVPVLSPDCLAELEVDALLVAVGVPGARSRIRHLIHLSRPRWREGVDWWAVC